MVFPEFFFCASLAVRRSVRSTILQYHASSVPMHIWKKPRSDMEQPLHPLPCCFHRSCGYSEWRNKVLRHVSIICQKLLSILRQAVSAMDGNNNSFPKHLRQPCKERRSFGVDVHHIVFSKCTIKCRKCGGADCGESSSIDCGNRFLMNTFIFNCGIIVLCTAYMMT